MTALAEGNLKLGKDPDVNRAATACLPALEMRAEQQRAAQTLLRPSAGTIGSDTLLRPAHGSTALADDLLRPAGGAETLETRA